MWSRTCQGAFVAVCCCRETIAVDEHVPRVATTSGNTWYLHERLDLHFQQCLFLLIIPYNAVKPVFRRVGGRSATFVGHSEDEAGEDLTIDPVPVLHYVFVGCIVLEGIRDHVEYCRAHDRP